MPNPQAGESQNDFIKRCIPIVLDDGTAKDSKQAYAICASMFSQKAALMKDGLPESAYMVVEDPKLITTWHLPVKDASGKADHRKMGEAWAALHGGFRGNKYEGPGKTAAIDRLKKLYAAEEMPMPMEKSFSTFKQTDGTYRWVTISSSAFKDRDGEIVSLDALKADVDYCDTTKDYGPLRWFHIGNMEAPNGLEDWKSYKAGMGIDLGTCDFNMVHGMMLIESGTYKNAEIGEAFSQPSLQESLGVSIGFSHPRDEPGANKVYKNIHRIERSLLPAGMASNLLTKYYVAKGENDMELSKKYEALKAILRNKPDLAMQILADSNSMEQAAKDSGMEVKEIEEMISTTGEDAPVEETAPVTEPPAETPAVETPAPVETPAEPVVANIGNMTVADLAAFVSEIVTQVGTKQVAPVQAKQAGIEAQLAEALVVLKATSEKLDTIEHTMAEQKQSLFELNDARPLGIKQLMAQRPSANPDNVTRKTVTGPTIDEGFQKFALGGK